MEQKNSNPIRRLFSKRGWGQVFTVTIFLIIMCIVFGIINPNFFSGDNVVMLLRQIAPILLVGIGQSYVLITGNIDLSIGSVIGMSCMVSATMMTKGVNPWVAVCITLVICLIAGFANGLLVSKCGLPPFIATLGTQTIMRGVAQIVNNNRNTDAIGQAAEGFRNVFYYGKTLGMFNIVWITIIVFIIFAFILSKTRTGRYIYAVGSNTSAARLSGVNVSKTIVTAYVVSAFCAALVGFNTVANSGMGSMDAGMNFEMYGVASSVIGGVSTLGGTGILAGTVIGAAIWSVLQNGLQFANAPVGLRNVVIGIIVIVSVLMDVILRQRRKK